MNITLTMRQRISIEALLSQDTGQGKDPIQLTKFDIYKKIIVKDRNKYVLEGPNGLTRVLEDAVDKAEDLNVDFSIQELRALGKLLEDAQVTVLQMVWWKPLMDSVDAAIKDAA